MYTRDGISEVRVAMMSIYMQRRGLMTKTFTSTNISHNIVKIFVLTGHWALQRLSIVLKYDLWMSYPRLEFIYGSNGCIEEARLFKPLILLIYHIMQALNVS